MRLWKAFFWFAGLYNLAIGLGMAAGAEQAAATLGVAGEIGVYAVRFIGAMIAVFGVGYCLVARDPIGNRAILVMGVVGKLAAVGIAIVHHAALPVSTLYLSLTDLPFAAAFLIFLARTKRP